MTTEKMLYHTPLLINQIDLMSNLEKYLISLSKFSNEHLTNALKKFTDEYQGYISTERSEELSEMIGSIKNELKSRGVSV